MIETIRITFRDFWEFSAREAISASVSGPCMTDYERLMKSYILPEWNGMELRFISSADVDRLLLKTVSGCSDITRCSIKAVLNKIFHLAQVKGLIGKNPVEDAMKVRIRPSDRFAFSEEETVRILKAFEKSNLNNLFTFQFLTGLSRAEVFGLRAGGIDLSAKTIKIDQFYRRCEDKTVISSSFQNAVKREIAIPSCAMEYLLSELVLREEKRKNAGDRWNNLYDLVFTNRYGGPVSLHIYMKTIKSLQSELGVNYSGCSSGQRNFGVMAISNGVSAVDLQKYLGYRTTQSVSCYCESKGVHTESVDLYYERMRQKEEAEEDEDF